MLLLLQLPDGAAGNSTAAWLGQRAALTHEVLGYGPGVLPNRSVPDLVLTWPTEPSLKGLVWDMSKYFTINSTVYASSPFFFHSIMPYYAVRCPYHTLHAPLSPTPYRTHRPLCDVYIWCLPHSLLRSCGLLGLQLSGPSYPNTVGEWVLSVATQHLLSGK